MSEDLKNDLLLELPLCKKSSYPRRLFCSNRLEQEVYDFPAIDCELGFDI